MGLTVDLAKLVMCSKTILIAVSSFVLAPTNLESHPDGIPASGFQEIGVEEIFGPTTQELVGLSGSLLDGKVDGLNLFKGFKATQENKEFYRLIFYTNQGFLETIFELREPNNESLLLQSKIYERQANESFINIGSDSQMPEVEAFIRSNYTELVNAELVDAWKSGDSQNNKISYRVFLLDSNIGLREAIVKVDPISGNSSETQIFVSSNLTQEIENFMEEVIEKQNLTESLSNTTLSQVIKTEEGNSSVFYVLYNHTEILLPTGLPAQSYFIFNITQNTSIPTFVRSYLYPLINNNSIITIQSDSATNLAIQMGPLQVYINKNSVQNSTVFPYIKQILQRSYTNVALSSQLQFAAYGHNTTHEVYEIVYKSLGRDPVLYTFMFALKKDNNVLSLARFFSYPESSKLVIKLSPSNQSQAMETAEPTMISILFSLVTSEPLFNPVDILEQMTRVEYYSIDPDSQVNTSVVAYYFKYKSNNSSVEFRYELSTSIMRLLPNLIYPLEQFRIVARQNVEIIALITDFIGHNLNETNISKFTIENIFESVERKEVYRVDISLVSQNGSQSKILYEFDIQDRTSLQIISDQDISNSTHNNTTNETNQTNSTTNPNSTNSTSNTNSTNNTNNTNSNALIEELLKEIIGQNELLSTTMSRLKEFVELQFQPELNGKTFIYARKLNASSYPEAITDGGEGDVVEFVYELNGKGFAIVVGLGHDSWQVQIVSSREIFIDASITEAIKKFYEIPETPSQVEIVQQMHPLLSSTFESMTNSSLDSDNIKSIEWGDWGMAVEDHLGRNFSFEKEKPYPEMNSQPLSINISEFQSRLVNMDIIKGVISEILNVKAEEIQNLDIKNVTSLLGLLDTYTVQFDLVSKQIDMGSKQKHTFIFEAANNGTLKRDHVDTKPSAAGGITIIKETPVLTNNSTIPPILTNPLTTPLTSPQQSPLTQPISPSVLLTSSMPIPRPILTSTLSLNQSAAILTSSEISQILTETNQNMNNSPNFNQNIPENEKKEKINSTFFGEFMRYQKGIRVNLPFNQSYVNLTAAHIIPILYISNETFSLSEMNKLGQISPVSFNASSILSRYGGNYRIVSQRSSLEGITSIQAISPKYGNLNFVANLSSNKLFTIDFQDAGFYVRGTSLNLKQFPNEESLEKIISPQLNIILDEFSLRSHNATLNFSQKANLSQNDLVFWKVKKSANIEEVEMNYEIFSYLVRVKGLLKRKEIDEFELTIFEMSILWNNLEELKNEVRNSRQHQIDMFKSRFEFQEVEKELMKNYGFYVGNSNILDVSMNEFRGEISFDITYQTSFGKMEGRVAYSIENKTSRVIYLVIPRSKPFSIIEKGCKAMLDSGLGCFECQNSFYLDTNFHCYSEIQGCFTQSGTLCLNCHNGYIMSDKNQCF